MIKTRNNMNYPLISIIIAVYNNERYLQNAIKSVQNQEFDDYEIIIVDDGSTDNTPMIVDEEARKDSRIKVIHQMNQWIYASFNNGVRAAQGEYIYILNSDDKLADGALKKICKTLVDNNYPDVIYTKVSWCDCDDNQNIISKSDLNPSIKENQYIDFRKEPTKWVHILESEIIMNQANLYKRELALLHPFRTDIFGADYLFNLELARDIQTAVVLSDEIYLFHYYGNGEMNASVGKYYGYEHDMYNEFYEKVEHLMREKGIYSDSNMERIKLFRRNDLRKEVRALLRIDKSNSIDEKIKIIRNNFWDETMAKCFSLKGKKGFDEVVDSEINKFLSQNNE